MKTLNIVDLFCGAGGTSTGIIEAVKNRMHRPIHLTAVNHWQTAINSHRLNHPEVTHICEPVENLHPIDMLRKNRLQFIDMLAASCECRFHGNCRGGGPLNEQSRAQPWQLIRWATDVHVRTIMMENVWEFQNWGPLHSRTLRPIKSRRGEYFRAFINALGNLFKFVEWKIQTAADYGDPTTRRRLILIARNQPFTWPNPTHGPGCHEPWKSAQDHVVDWNIRGKSLFGTDAKPRLCKNTVDRIEAGLKKFGGATAEPFLLLLRGTSKSHLVSCARSLRKPIPSLTAGGTHMMICEPFIMHITHRGSHSSRCHSTQKPLPTVTTANRGEMALVQPLIMKYYKTGVCKPLDGPLDTITTKARFMLIETRKDELIGFDILTRMLQPHELSAAHSFPTNYKLTGNKADQIKQIGNSVPIQLAAAHAHAALS